jgi:putative membrane protein
LAPEKSSDSAIVVRPSSKLLKPVYTLAFILIAVAYGFNNNRADRMDWLVIPPLLLLVWTMYRHFLLRFITLKLEGKRLRYETGLFSRSSRTMELNKVQDVRVDQSFSQRMLGIGNLSIESAGESGGLTINNIDQPDVVAGIILDAARK